ncbi:MAG: DUF6786 family protein, partial [Longimicrobiales bacterium]
MRGMLVSLCVALAAACGSPDEPAKAPTPRDGPRRYQADIDLLRSRLDVVELMDATGRGRVAIVPAYQGRVMTSTAGGPDGWSLG